MIFETEDLFKTGLPPSTSSTESKNRLKSPSRIIILFSKLSNVSSFRFIFSNVEICPFLVFGINRLIQMKTQSSIIAYNNKNDHFHNFSFLKA